MNHYRIREDGEIAWQGKATDADDALERFFEDEDPSPSIFYTVEVFGEVQFSKTIKGKGWTTAFSGRLISS